MPPFSEPWNHNRAFRPPAGARGGGGEQFFRSLAEQSGEAHFVKNERGVYLYVNPAGARLLGRSLSEIVGHDDSSVFPPKIARRIVTRDERILREGVTTTEEEELLVKGRRLVVLITKSPHRDPSGAVCGIVGVARDVTEQRQAAEDRDRLIEELERERRIREALVAGFGHDLRSPLLAARITAQSIARQIEPSHPAQPLAARIVRCLDRGERLIRNLLDGSRLGAGEVLQLERSHLELGDVLEETLGSLQLLHGNCFCFSRPPHPVAGYWDREALSRMLENLASNAVKYGTAGAPVTVEVGVRETEESETEGPAWFSVHNLGAPIPVAGQEELFSLFRRSAERTAGAKGWGIGLAIVKGLAEALGGRVELESREHFGTRFTVTLPRALPPL